RAAAAGGVEWEVVRMVGPEGLVGAGVEVADRSPAGRVDRGDRRRIVDVVASSRRADRVDQRIDVEDLRGHHTPADEGNGGDARIDAARAREGAVAGLGLCRLELVLPATL